MKYPGYKQGKNNNNPSKFLPVWGEGDKGIWSSTLREQGYSNLIIFDIFLLS